MFLVQGEVLGGMVSCESVEEVVLFSVFIDDFWLKHKGGSILPYMIDTHCHLADKKFAKDLPEVLERAKNAGVERMIAIADSLEEGEKCLQIAQEFSQVFCTVGLHPHHAKLGKDGDRKRLKDMVLSSDRVVAIGEIGLDYHYTFAPPDVQKRVFREQLELAKELGKPAVIHCREALKDVWEIVKSVRPGQIVLHCCTEKFEDVQQFLDRGDFLSFTGIVTFPQAQVRRTVRLCPLTQMMIETDAPYLAPVPHRGKRNEPAFVVEIVKRIAQLKEVSLEEVDRSTTKNAVEFFGLP